MGTRDISGGMVSEGTMTINEAIAFSRLSRSFLYSLMDSGRLAYVKLGKVRRIPRRALTDMLSQALIGAEQGKSFT